MLYSAGVNEQAGPATTGPAIAGSVTSVHFDHHSPEFAADPWPMLADLRARCPVAHSDAYGGFWVVTGYDDIKRVALDDATFSSAETILIPPKKNAAPEVDPDRDGRAGVPRVPQDHAAAVRPAGGRAPRAGDRVLRQPLHRRVHRARRGRRRARLRRPAAGDGDAAQARAADRRVAPLRRADAQDRVPPPGQPGPRTACSRSWRGSSARSRRRSGSARNRRATT